jgi:hypothetical protein
MRAGFFSVTGKDGQEAQVTIVPLAGLGGGDLENVNRWRGQVGLGPITAEELSSQESNVVIAGQTGKLFEIAGTIPNQKDKTRILAAILRRGGMTWFFKMTGGDALVQQEKAAFQEFMKGISFP